MSSRPVVFLLDAQLEGLFGRLGINAMLERVPRWRD
jgi:hypothetical protein